ncbi:bleomycin hydrolase [Balneicella halophila]|uniref:Aminopeptidase n=1 Tax=Balneicella halophila TaxID=1537566 RepID=A0A7L4USM4_BALHA|nr:C1 family peptidase [Balneicella halophila]PVX52522.1 bleomycin hydrolase [Balneicella halophila]
MKQLLYALLLCFTFTSVYAQDTKKEEKPEGYKFTDIINLDITPVKDQNRSGTCWSFSANSFFEQEMLRMGKPVTDLSEMFVVRHTYTDKAEKYVRLHGYLNFAQGGAFHDNLYVFDKYGIVPESVYSGLEYGEKGHVHGEVEAVLRGIADAAIKNPNRKLSPKWKVAFEGALDAYFGELPKSFVYDGKTYTPKSFLTDYCGIVPEDYVAIGSYTHHPFYEEFIFEVQDNWLWKTIYNVPLDEMMQVIDNALETGYSVAWAADVSEKGFNTKKVGVAIVPETNIESMDQAEIGKWEAMSEAERNKKIYSFDKPGKEKVITQELRQEAFDNYQSTDDHGMHIYGTATDQIGNKYYKVKNSWGNYNDFDGSFYVSKPYVAYKTMNILVHKDAIPQAIKNKLGIK